MMMVTTTDKKSFLSSKLNWTGFIMAMVGLYSDPAFQQYLVDVIPPEILPRVLSIGGMVVLVLRTFFTSQGISTISLGKGKQGTTKNVEVAKDDDDDDGTIVGGG